ncbi:hypothetical protein ACMGE7_07575 [Macrococcus equi]
MENINNVLFSAHASSGVEWGTLLFTVMSLLVVFLIIYLVFNIKKK